MIFNCPGSSKFKQPYPESVACPNCHIDVEVWTDEYDAVCPKCKNRVTRQSGQSCLDWCKYAKECVGNEIYDEYMRKKEGGDRR